jgi:crossover junction endodeoxyribonuclease RusA
MMTVTLPWPPKELNPGQRVSWADKAKAAEAYRADCRRICQQDKLTAPKTDGKIHLWVTFFAPTRRRVDDNNLINSFQAGRDGVADVLGIDDNRFACHFELSDQIGGMIKIKLTDSGEEPK